MPTAKRDAVAARSGASWIVRAWKWGAGTLSAGAALVSIISSVRSLPADQVRWIGVRPLADTAWAIGDSVQLALTITDAHGGLVSGVRVGWTSTDTMVATVDSAGTVVARSPGATTVVAAAGGRIAQARVHVRQRAAAIWLQGDSVLRLGEGASTRLVARVVDARRHQLPGQSISWRTSDPTVITVDSLGRVAGMAAGTATLVATGGDVVLERPVEVAAVPATITLLAGDGQRAQAGHRLPLALKAQIVSRGGRPMAGVAARFASVDATGRFVPEVDTSDADGLVQAVWTLGERPGRQRSSVAVDGQPPIATSLAADAEPLPGTVRVTAADVPGGVVGSELPEAVTATVVDTGGAPLSDVAVSWETESGSIVAEASRTDSLGNARARWTLGPRAGLQRAYLRVGGSRNGPRSAVTATALPGPATALAVVRRNTLHGVAGRPLAGFELRASDRYGNPVPEVRVSLRPAQGAVAERAVMADSAGRVTPIWTLGTAAGVQRLTASVEGMPAPLEIAVRVTAAAPAKVAFEGVPASGTVARPLPQTIRAMVSDAHGNPAAGVSVVFSTKTGTVAPARARTDSTGRALTRWTLGSRVGDQVLEAVVKDGGARGVARLRGVRSRRGS